VIRGLVTWLRRRIALKLTLTLVGFVAVSLLVAGFYLNRALQAVAVSMVEARLQTAAQLLHDDVRALLLAAPRGAVRQIPVRASSLADVRLTVVATDGRVVADSRTGGGAPDRDERPGERPEIRAALAGRPGRDIRARGATSAPLLHVALPVREDGRIIGALRLTLPLAAVTSAYAPVQGVLLAGGLLALAVALGIGILVARRLTRPVIAMEAAARRMSEGDFTVKVPVRSPDEIGVLGRALNLTASRLREKIQDLEEEQAKARAILESMVEGVIAVDGRDHIVVMNEGARRIFELRRAPEGRPFLEVIRNVDLHQILRELRAAPRGPMQHRELRLSTPVERMLAVNAVPLPIGGAEVGVVMVLHDVSELRRLEQVRTEFVANVSHELRTPLTAIHGYIETLLDGALEEPEHARRFLEIAHRHTERLGRLIDDLTDLSNIELGKVELHVGPVAVADVVESILLMIRPRAEQGEVALATEVAPGLSVLADRDRLAQILINLVDNAVKYTPAGGRVTVRAAGPTDGLVEIAVIDTGIGIPPSDLPRITERFYRVDRARSRELGGTGLGLAIVKHLVTAHGGQLRIESQPDHGTTVRVTLPAGDRSEPQA
jgi:two-component system phosphate regulon sensor histidine kinase PhoR